MFGDLSGMMKKLQETQQKVEETKKRLDSVLIDEDSCDGKVSVTVTANSQIKSISINDSLLSDTDELEDYLILTLNKALEKAKTINENELASVAKMGMPKIPGMNF